MPLEFVYNKIKNTLRKIDMKLERAKYSYIDKMPKDIEYPEGGLYDVVYESSCKWPHNTALQYFDTEITYKELIKKINKAAAALKSLGAEKGDYITVCMPNTPEAIYMFYAINEIGAIANMVHPLSSENEIEDYVNQTEIDNLEDYFDLFAPEEFKKYREKIKAIDAAHKAKGILT